MMRVSASEQAWGWLVKHDDTIKGHKCDNYCLKTNSTLPMFEYDWSGLLEAMSFRYDVRLHSLAR